MIDYLALLLGGFLYIGLKYAGPFMMWSMLAFFLLCLAYRLIQKRKPQENIRLLITAAGVIGLVMTLLYPGIFLGFIIFGFVGMAMLFQVFRSDFFDMMIVISAVCGVIALLVWVKSRRSFLRNSE